MGTLSSHSKLYSGSGRIVLSSHNQKPVFAELSSSYPLKLLSPRITEDGVAVVYIVTYGGGLVGGDHILLSVNVQLGAKLVLLSQGSTKVFKSRLGTRLASVKAEVEIIPNNIAAFSLTTQRIRFSVGANSCLFLLPEPVTCFRDASYNQIQTFDLRGNATVVVLDWITSGRKTRGEDWVFSRYYSANEITVDGKEVAKDILLLDDETLDFQFPLPRRSMATRLAPYSCYATVILYGPQVRENIRTLNAQYDTLSVFKTKAPTDLIWSFSPIDNKKEGAVVRVAGKDTEAVRLWLRQALKGLEPSIGIDVFRAAFP